MTSLALLTVMAVTAPQPVICLDPGHPSEVGKGTRGKKVTELTAVWEIAVAAKPILEAKGIKVVMTKSSEEEFVANKKRAETANKAKADLMVRLHMDAAPARGWGTYYPHQQGTVQGVTGPSKWVLKESKAAATAFHKGVFSVLKGKHPDRGLMTEAKTAVGARQGALTGSIFSEVPVVLVEMATLTLKDDEAFVASASGKKLLVDAVVAGTEAALKARKRL